MLNMQPLPVNWKLGGLAVVAKDTTAVTEGTTLGLEARIQSLELAEMHDVLDKFNLYAFVSESHKEHGFAKHKQKGQ